jgi:zinc protease
MRWLSLLLLAGCAVKVARGPVPVEEAATGPELVVQQDDAAPAAYFVAMVHAGSAYDGIGAEGVAGLTAEVLAAGGAGDRSAEQVRDFLYEMGNDLDVVVGKEWASFRLRCPATHAAACGALFADMLVAPRFEPDEVARLRDEAAYHLRDGLLGDEERLAYDALDAWLFEGHPYGHPVEGQGGVVPLLDADALRRFHERHYLRSTVVVGLGGAVDAGLLADLQRLGTRLPADLPLQRPLPIDGRHLLAVSTDTDVVGFRMGHPLSVSRGDEDWPALYLAMTAFGAHRQSFGTLFRSLRGARGLNYGTYAYVEPFRERQGAAMEDNGMLRQQPFFHLWIRPTSTDNGAFALKLALDELETLVDDGLDAETFDDVQSYLEGAVPLLARDPGRRLLYAVEATAAGTPNPLEGLRERVAALTLDEVNAALKQHLRPGDLKIVAVGGGATAVADALTADAPTPMTYQGLEPDAEQAARDEAVSAASVGLASTSSVEGRGLFSPRP